MTAASAEHGNTYLELWMQCGSDILPPCAGPGLRRELPRLRLYEFSRFAALRPWVTPCRCCWTSFFCLYAHHGRGASTPSISGIIAAAAAAEPPPGHRGIVRKPEPPRWKGRWAACWGAHDAPRASNSSRSGNRQANLQQHIWNSTSSIKCARQWGQQLHVVPLGEHCGNGNGKGIRARGYTGGGVEPQELSLSSWTPQTSGCLGHAGIRGHSESENNSLGQR